MAHACKKCDGTGWVYVPFTHPKPIGGYLQMGTHVKCKHCKNGVDVTHSSKKGGNQS